MKTPFHAPNANAYAERWVRGFREECLNHLVLFGLKSLRRVVRTYQRFFNERRPHQGIGNRLPQEILAGKTDIPTIVDGPVGEIECEEFLGGLLKSYSRKAT